MQDPSFPCDLHHSSQERQILDPLNETRDWTCILMNTSHPAQKWELPSFITNKNWKKCNPTKRYKLIMINYINVTIYFLFILFYFIFCLIAICWAAPMAYGGSQARGQIKAVAAGLHHSHSNVGSEPHLWPTPQLTAMTDPQNYEQGQRVNPQPHGSRLDL